MLERIRQIGIFMIAAQAVIHFAPGKQYEKYIKSVSGMIILLLFLKPFLQLAGVSWEDPQVLLEKMEELTDMPDISEGTVESADDKVARRLEKEVEELLNRDLEGEDYTVKNVSVRLCQEPGTGTLLSVVEVDMAEKGGKSEEREIAIDRIAVGKQPDPVSREAEAVYKKRFAKLLGIGEERMEVRCDGGG